MKSKMTARLLFFTVSLAPMMGSVVGCSDIKIIGDTSSLVERNRVKPNNTSSQDAAVDPLAEKLIEATHSTIGDDGSHQGSAKDPHAVSSKVVSSQTEIDDKALSLVQIGPVTKLFDATNLERVLRPIFGTHGQITTTDMRYFSPEDKIRLGEYSLFTVPNLFLERIGGQVQFSQDYIFAMRTFAGRACTNLVKAELADPDRADNFLVREGELDAGRISVDTIQLFMSKVFGLSSSGKSFFAGAQEFAAVFKEAVESADEGMDSLRTRDKAIEDNYILTCVYVVTDPRTFSR